MDILTDVLIISIPVAILRHVQIPIQKKLLLLGIFSATVLIMAVSVVRVVLVSDLGSQLREPSIDWLYLWSNVEMGVGKLLVWMTG